MTLHAGEYHSRVGYPTTTVNIPDTICNMRRKVALSTVKSNALESQTNRYRNVASAVLRESICLLNFMWRIACGARARQKELPLGGNGLSKLYAWFELPSHPHQARRGMLNTYCMMTRSAVKGETSVVPGCSRTSYTNI